MSFLTPNSFYWGQPFTQVGGATSADPQLQFFENFPGHLGAAFNGRSSRVLSVHAVNIPLNISFNNVAMLFTRGADNATRSATLTYRFGLYSKNGNSLSLANSASGSDSWGGANTSTVWLTMVTSATQNISPGAWYFAHVNDRATNAAGADNYGPHGNTSINPGNAIPGGFVMGRMTATTNAFPAAIATSDLDITGSDAIRQFYILITA